MILILGGGLAGLSTAYHLGDRPHLVVEGALDAGGLCRSREIDGFVFDYTGHLLHLRDERIVRLVDKLLPDTFDTIERKARVLMHGRTLPFPFQANLHGLPKEVVAKCLVDFVGTLGKAVPDDPATSFEDWSLAVFGRGISDLFMFPYNTKLYTREPAGMTADWVSWAVPKPSLDELVRGALGIPNEGMGYNPTFRYPKKGGIGVLAAALAAQVGHMRYGERVEAVDLARKTARLSSGDTIAWERLVVTGPLPEFLRMTTGGAPDLAAQADRLDWSVVACVNFGIDRAEVADGAHWLYVSDPDIPFYRVGFPSNMARGTAPAGKSSLYVEFGLPRDAPWDPAALEQQALEGLERLGLLAPGERILVRDTVRIDPGYVIFDRERQEVMRRVVPELRDRGVHLIGRYGAWTYSYMERAMLDGLELAEELLREPAVETTGARS